MALHAKTDFLCTLKDNEQKELLRFKATAASDLIFSADYGGGGVASVSQAFTISTEKEYDFKPFTYLQIRGINRTFKIVSVDISFRKLLGTIKRMKKIYILELQ